MSELNKCKYRDDKGHCTGQKNAPKCYYDLNSDCKIYKPTAKGIKVEVKASLNWEKICRHLIFTYGLSEEEIGNYISEHITEFADIKLG